jgi:Flp pilus assembly pilin Flp
MNRLFKRRPGQNTVEYLLMLAVVVGVVLVIGALLKSKLPDVFTKVQALIMGAADKLGRE